MRGTLGAVVLFAVGVASVWTLGAGARAEALPHFTMTSGRLSPSGSCSQGAITLVVQSGQASSPELGNGTFSTRIDLAYSGISVLYRESFTVHFSNGSGYTGVTTGTGHGQCNPGGTASGSFSTSVTGSESGSGSSVVTIAFPSYSHSFTPNAAPVSSSAAATTTVAATTTSAQTTTTASQTTTTASPTTTNAPPSAPRVAAEVDSFWFAYATYTTNGKLVVNGVSPGTGVQLRCTGKGCPFTAKSYVVTKAGSLALTKALKKAKLGVGATVEVRITKPGEIGKAVRFTMRKSKFPKTVTLCLPPGSSKPGAC